MSKMDSDTKGILFLLLGMMLLVIVLVWVLRTTEAAGEPVPVSRVLIRQHSGTIHTNLVKGKRIEYQNDGCHYVGVSKVDLLHYNVWCAELIVSENK